MKIGLTVAGVGAMQGLAVLDVKAGGRKVLLIHAAVHRKAQAAALGVQVFRQRREIPVRGLVRPAPRQPDFVAAQVERADGIIGAVEGDGRAIFRAGRSEGGEEQDQGEPEARDNLPGATNRTSFSRSRMDGS